MRYNKQPIDIPDQLALLKQRGMIVNNENATLRQLESISYFRLANYWKVFETDDVTHRLVPGTQLEDEGCGGKEDGCQEFRTSPIPLYGKLDA